MTISETESAIAFVGWPKTPRLFRGMTVTEKIDGTNSAVIIEDDHGRVVVGAQSRNRIITPGKSTDNHGFAAWVHDNADMLADILGPGRHFGEWWGSGIQRGYGLPQGEKRFSLFNVNRYETALSEYYINNGQVWPDLIKSHQLGTVPVLYRGPFDLERVRQVLDTLRFDGSCAVSGFMNPEGVVVFHEAAGQIFKATIDGDEAPKSLAAA
jgi:hypothetical protein